MANRYWVGGTASWDGTAGTKWASSSGGTGGASVPTTADAVFFDGSSTGTVTIATGNAGAASIDCTGFTGTITGTTAITVAGSITLVAGMTYSHTGTVTIAGTSTLTTAGKTFSGLTISGSGITVTLGDALNISTRTLTVTQGTFNTANYSVTASVLSSSNSNTRTITFGSSTVTLSSTTTALNFNTTTNLTFNANTSQINISSVSGALNGGGQTFYNVSFTSTSLQGGISTASILGANTFNNLTFNAPSSNAINALDFDSNQTINGTLTCSGPSIFRRCMLLSSLLGTARTLTVASLAADNCDFRDITIAGAASGSSPANAGNCGGNTGITFPAAKTAYRVGTSTTWAGSSSWALTSGGAGSDANFPLPQDTVVINDDTTLTGTLTVGGYNKGAFDCSARTTGITIGYSAGGILYAWYGSHTLSSAITIAAGSTSQYFVKTVVFTSAGKTIPFPNIYIQSTETFSLGDALTFSGRIVLDNGTFDTNSYSITSSAFDASLLLATATLNLNATTWTLTGDTGTASVYPWDVTTSSTLTINAGTSNLLVTGGPRLNFGGGGKSYNKLTVGGSVASTTLDIVDLNTSFQEIASTKTIAHGIQFNSNIGTIGTWSVTGTAGNVVTIDSNTPGTRRTFTLTNISRNIDYLSVRDIGELNGNKFYVGTNSTNVSNNSNVYFTEAPPAATSNMFMLLW